MYKLLEKYVTKFVTRCQIREHTNDSGDVTENVEFVYTEIFGSTLKCIKISNFQLFFILRYNDVPFYKSYKQMLQLYAAKNLNL